MAFKFLRLPIQHFSADTGAGGTGTAAAPDPSLAGAGGTSAATGGDSTQSAAGDTTAGGGDKTTGSQLSPEDLKRYEESEFLKALGYTSIDAVKDALAAAGKPADAKDDSKKQADDDKTGDKKDAADDKKTDGKAAETKADDKAGEKKADETPPDTKEPEKEPEPTVAEKEAEIADLKAQLAATKAGVKEDSLDDVLVLAKALSTKGEGMEIDAAIKAVIDKYPSFAGAAAPDPGKPRFGDSGSQRQADDRDPFVRTLLGT